jgi:nucleotide-binding universal stress UspA family protein
MKNINTILCPVDFSEPSYAALESAVDLAECFSAKIVLFHAVSNIDPTPTPSYTLTNQIADQIPQIMQQMTENATQALKELTNIRIAGRVPTQQMVEIGDPANSIVQAAKTRSVDLIVIATHGRSGIKGLIFGSVAEKVVRTAECPVLTMRHKAA